MTTLTPDQARLPIAVVAFLMLTACGNGALAPTCNVSTLNKTMTREYVLEICGKPQRINASSYGDEQWVYDYSSYIYIQDGYFKSAQWSYKL